MDKTLLEPEQTLQLISYHEKINEFQKLYNLNKFPKVIMLSGEKGIGKFTFIIHLIISLIDKENYDLKNLSISSNSLIHKEIISKVFSNVIIIKGDNNESVKIEDIRRLKEIIFKSNLNDKPRFIILDDMDKFNMNCQNALLKIIEEPPQNNYFILINNKKNKIAKTIQSRSLEFKFFLSESEKIFIIKQIIKKNDLECNFDYLNFPLSLGKFINFNYLNIKEKIDLNQPIVNSIGNLLKLFRKTKNNYCILFIKYLLDNNIYKKINLKDSDLMSQIDNKNETLKLIDDFVLFNLNYNSTLQLISEKFNE